MPHTQTDGLLGHPQPAFISVVRNGPALREEDATEPGSARFPVIIKEIDADACQTLT